MTDGDDILKFEDYLNPQKREQMINDARNDPAKARWMQEMALKCHICKRLKALHNMVADWDGHPWCKDNLEYLGWKFRKKGIQ